MSFLQQLQQQRNVLKTTTTTVTTASGERYLESGKQNMPIQKLEKCSYGFVIDTKPDNVPACIIDKLIYLGAQDAVSVHNIDVYHITHILSVGIETPAVEAKVKTKCLPCLDLPETQLYADGIVQAAVEFIEHARLQQGCVLVHCNAGVSRSASVVIAYLMQARRMHYEAAYNLVKSKRACIRPNDGFMRQLKAQENSV